MDRRGLREELRSLDAKNGRWLAATCLLTAVLALSPWGLQLMGFQLGGLLGAGILALSGIMLVVALVIAFRLNRAIGVLILSVFIVLGLIGWKTISRSVEGNAHVDPNSLAEDIYKRLVPLLSAGAPQPGHQAPPSNGITQGQLEAAVRKAMSSGTLINNSAPSPSAPSAISTNFSLFHEGGLLSIFPNIPVLVARSAGFQNDKHPVTPIDGYFFLSMTNIGKREEMIRQYQLYDMVGDKWIALCNVPTLNRQVIGVSGDPSLRSSWNNYQLWNIEKSGFDYQVYDKTIMPNQTIKGAMFFQYPNGINQPNVLDSIEGG